MAYPPPPLPPLRSPRRNAIRWMIRSDLPGVMEIDRESFLNPWTHEAFLAHLRQRNAIGLVIEQDELTLAGYMLYEIASRHIFLLRVAVHPQFREQGRGRALIERLIAKLTPRRPKVLTDVCERDMHACLFLQSLGFLACHVNRRQFDPQDGYRFEYRISPGDRVLASVLGGSGRTLTLPDEADEQED